MMQFDRISLGRQAQELGFVRDTFEKVTRLAEVLSFMENDPLLSDSLALKGGTAINLTVFDLPRLSVDIDMDYAKNVPREAMLREREQMNDRIRKYMTAAGYQLSPKSKFRMCLYKESSSRITPRLEYEAVKRLSPRM